MKDLKHFDKTQGQEFDLCQSGFSVTLNQTWKLKCPRSLHALSYQFKTRVHIVWENRIKIWYARLVFASYMRSFICHSALSES